MRTDEKLIEKKPGYFFERLKDEDINECIDVIIKSIGETFFNKEILKQMLKDPNVITLVAKSEKIIKGVINGMTSNNPIQPVKITFVGVMNKESVMNGLPGMLIDEFINELKNKFSKTSLIDANLVSKDTNAVTMYSSKGFVVEGFIKDGLGNADIVILRKRFKIKDVTTIA